MIRTVVLALATIALLTGCAQLRSTTAGQVGAALIPALAATPSPEDAAAQAAAAGFSPESVVANPENFILVEVNGLGINGLALKASQSGGHTTFVGDTGYSVSFADGMLVSTRGFGKDLMAADASAVRAALRAGGGTAQRAHDYLDSRDRIVTESYDCTVTPTGPQEVNLGIRVVTAESFTELCVGQRLGFENLYFVDEAGTIIASRQYISDIVAYLRNNIL